ncbi:MAG: hypothetical protein ABIK73_09000 [candidate division WOR-3 bacterium]
MHDFNAKGIGLPSAQSLQQNFTFVAAYKIKLAEKQQARKRGV